MLFNTLQALTGRPNIAIFSAIRTICGYNSQILSFKQKLFCATNTHQWIASCESHSFMSRTTAHQLWKGATSLSPAGRKKGRGKARRRIIDLNKGQVIGFGPKNMLWPGLNSPIIRGKEIVTQKELEPDKSREERINALRDRITTSKRIKLTPLERGWSGTKLPGRSLGPPDPVADETFEGFDSRVLEFKTVMKRHGQRGRIRRFSAFVVIGNKKGLVGYSLGKSPLGMTAAHGAKNKAAKVLRYVERDNEHTIMHDFHTEFGATTIFAKKKPKGHGLVCHRVIREICKMAGITDIYAKIFGSHTNPQNITKAFVIGLMKQRTPQEIAEEKGLHVVEFRNEQDFYPKLIASPTKCRTEEEIPVNEILDYNYHVHNGMLMPPFKKYEPFYFKLPTHLKKLKEDERFRNHHQMKLQLMAKYNCELKSFLTVREEEKEKEKLKGIIESS